MSSLDQYCLDIGQKCPVCGISGIHACPGGPIPPWTQEAKDHLVEVLKGIFGESVVDHGPDEFEDDVVDD